MATWSPTDNSGLSLSNGNLTATNTLGSGVWYACRATPFFQTSAKVYAEFIATAAGVSDSAIYLAVMNASAALGQPGLDGNSFGYNQNGSTAYNGGAPATIAAWATGDVISLAVDAINQTIWARVNGGNWNNDGTADPSTNTGGIGCAAIFALGTVFFATSIHTQNYAITANINAPFTYAIPSGFTAQPPVIAATIAGAAVSGAVPRLGPRLLQQSLSLVATGTLARVLPMVAAMPNVFGQGSIGTLIINTIGNALHGVQGQSALSAPISIISTSIYNYEGFDHQTNQTDLLAGPITAFINSSGSLSPITPYMGGNSLAVRVLAGSTPSAGFAIVDSGGETISSATVGIMLRSHPHGDIGTDFGLMLDHTPQIFCRISASNISLYRGSPITAPTLLQTLFNVVPATGWFYLELSVVIASGTSGSVAIQVNGVQIANYTSINTSSDGTARLNGLLLGGTTAANTTTDFLFDDVYIATSLLGPVRVSTVFPVANGSQVQFLTSTGSPANWQQVAESAMDADGSYNFTGTFGLSDQFALNALPPTASTIYGLKVTMAARRDAANDLAMSTLLVSNAAKSYGEITPLANAYHYISSIYPLDPSTGVAWTPNSISAAQIGYGIVNAAIASIATAPSLDFNFTLTNTLDSRVVFTRASTATYYDATGQLQNASANVPRFDYGYNPNGATNLILQSGSLTVSPWTARNSVSVTSGQSAPDGTTTAYKIANPSSSVAIWDIYQDLPQAISTIATVYTASVYAKDAGNGWLHMQLWDASGTGSGLDAWFNLASGTLGNTQISNTATSVSSAITSLGNGWYRCSLTGIPSTATSCSSLEFVLRLSKTDNDNSPASPVIGNGIYLWQPQLERNTATANAYVTTTTEISNAGATPIGLLIEEARTNGIRNPRAEGSVIGTPGTLPTNWQIVNPAGLSSSVIASGSENGLPYLDIRFNGTSTATTISIVLESFGNIAATVNSTWAHAFYLRLVAGSISNIVSVSADVESGNAGLSLLTTYPGTVYPAVSMTTAALSTQRRLSSVTVTDATTAWARPRISINISNAASLDFTLRIGAPQLEQGNVATSVILPPVGVPAATGRAVENATVATFGSYFQATGGALALEALWLTPGVPPVGNHAAFQLIDNTTNNSLELLNQAGQPTAALTSLSSLGPPALSGNLGAKTIVNGTIFAYAVSWNGAGSYTDAANGVQGGTATASLPQNLSSLTLGNDAASVSPLDAYVRRFRYWPRFMQIVEVVGNTST